MYLKVYVCVWCVCMCDKVVNGCSFADSSSAVYLKSNLSRYEQASFLYDRPRCMGAYVQLTLQFSVPFAVVMKQCCFLPPPFPSPSPSPPTLLPDLEDAGRIQQQKRAANLLTFSELHKLKRIGLEDSYMEPPQGAELAATMKQGMATMETLKMLQEEAELIASPRGAKKRWERVGWERGWEL